MTNKDLYQEVTNIIIEALDNNIRPWVQPWEGMTPLALPMRHNGEAYKGINVVTLWAIAQSQCYMSPYWMTYKQAKDLGGQVRKGEKAVPVFYAGKLLVENDNLQGDADENDEKMIYYMKSYAVFNVAQIDGLPEKYYWKPELKEITLEKVRNKQVDQFIVATGADIRYGFNSAFFHGGKDYIGLPYFEHFKTSDGYYATLFHELTHWSGHKSRLDRENNSSKKQIKTYAFEELVAELGAAFLCADHEIKTDFEAQHATYIKSWLQLLNNDKKAIFRAASMAQKAVDYLHGL